MEVFSQEMIDKILKGPDRDYTHLVTPEETQRIVKNLSKQKHHSTLFMALLIQAESIVIYNGNNKHEAHILALDFLYHAGRREIGDFYDNQLWKKSIENGVSGFVEKILAGENPKGFLNLSKNWKDRRTVDWETEWMHEERLYAIENGLGANIAKWARPPFITVPKVKMIYKVMRLSDGLFSMGHSPPQFNKIGKSWNEKNLKLHLVHVVDGPTGYPKNDSDFDKNMRIYDNCVVVPYKVVESEETHTDMKNWAEENGVRKSFLRRNERWFEYAKERRSR